MSRTTLNLRAVRTWLAREGLSHRYGTQPPVVAIPIPGAAVRAVRVVELKDRGLMVFALPMLSVVPPSRYADLYPLLSQVNSSLFIGAWVLEPAKGELLFRVAVPTAGVSYTDAWLRAVVEHVVTTVRNAEAAFLPVLQDDILASWESEDEPV